MQSGEDWVSWQAGVSQGLSEPQAFLLENGKILSALLPINAANEKHQTLGNSLINMSSFH